MARKLVGEGEHTRETVPGVRHGLSIYEHTEQGTVTGYDVVLRSRSYDGVRVAGKWDSPPIELDTTDRTEATRRANSHLRALVTALRGGA